MDPPSTASSSKPLSLDQALRKPTVIGIYGIPGSGKTYLLGKLKSASESPFAFYEGSEVIGSMVPGGLPAFLELGEPMQTGWRGAAITRIQRECKEADCTGVVSGHYMFWVEGEERGKRVVTKMDFAVYTHIIYLDIPAVVIRDNRRGDTRRIRHNDSVEHLEKWKTVEKAQLRSLCWEKGIIFTLVSGPPNSLVIKINALLVNFHFHNEQSNLDLALKKASRFVTWTAASRKPQLDTILVMDADRTLAAQDTGPMFWKAAAKSAEIQPAADPDVLKKLFNSSMGYSYTAFRQASLLYEEVPSDSFEALCDEVSLGVKMHPEFIRLLRAVGSTSHIAVVIVTCGLAGVWERVLGREDLPRSVQIIGGGRTLADFGSVVVTPDIKAAIVEGLSDDHKMCVWAFGDSPLDLPMLLEADEAIVVVGEEHLRSKTMDVPLASAIKDHGLKARQVTLPKGSPPRLDMGILPLVELTDDVIANSLNRRHPRSRIHHATERNSAKLLMTPTRNANVAGPSLRQAHHQVGRYLATEFLTEIIGVESYDIPHVQGGVTKGHRLRNEEKTVIAALMRGGEPMALGVSEVFPQATFLHARGSDDLDYSYLDGHETLLLVDSVINTGMTIIFYIREARLRHPRIKIVVVAGVVQDQCVSPGMPFYRVLEENVNVSIVALRLSENSYIGRGGTDTGHRLFNTTHRT